MRKKELTAAGEGERGNGDKTYNFMKTNINMGFVCNTTNLIIISKVGETSLGELQQYSKAIDSILNVCIE